MVSVFAPVSRPRVACGEDSVDGCHTFLILPLLGTQYSFYPYSVLGASQLTLMCYTVYHSTMAIFSSLSIITFTILAHCYYRISSIGSSLIHLIISTFALLRGSYTSKTCFVNIRACINLKWP